MSSNSSVTLTLTGSVSGTKRAAAAAIASSTTRCTRSDSGSARAGGSNRLSSQPGPLPSVSTLATARPASSVRHDSGALRQPS